MSLFDRRRWKRILGAGFGGRFFVRGGCFAAEDAFPIRCKVVATRLSNVDGQPTKKKVVDLIPKFCRKA